METVINRIDGKIHYYKSIKENLIFVLGTRANPLAIERLNEFIRDLKDIKHQILLKNKQHDLTKNRFRSTKSPQVPLPPLW